MTRPAPIAARAQQRTARMLQHRRTAVPRPICACLYILYARAPGPAAQNAAALTDGYCARTPGTVISRFVPFARTYNLARARVPFAAPLRFSRVALNFATNRAMHSLVVVTPTGSSVTSPDLYNRSRERRSPHETTTYIHRVD